MRRTRLTRILVRRWRWRWRRNPLRRHTDAVEAWIVLVAWALATIGGAVAGAVSAQATETALMRSRAERREVSAVLLETAPADLVDMTTGDICSRVRAQVRWTDSDGVVRTDGASVRAGTKSGATVPVWTDGHGRLVPEPMGPGEARARAILTGAGATVFGGLVILAAGRVVRLGIEHRATERWGEEWARVGPRWGRRTG
ncbi:hypothetical protein ACFW9L_01775 [Streptomyces sp. NPDC059517]|uniref:Rv1733c family protein n=1 Tax=Streptomyces sp. NPDC059517 TaxID=3346855 RepID=UPI00368AEE00